MRWVRPALTVPAALVSAAAAAQAPQPPPTDPLRDHYQAAQTFQLAGDLDRAESEYAREVIPRALRRLAALASAEGRHGEAGQYLQEARGFRPADVELALDVAVVDLRSGDIQDALELARDVSTRDPGNTRALRLQGKALLITGENAEARAVLERSMALAASFDTGLSLAYANLRTLRLTEARALFDEMIARNASAEVRTLIARAYLENGHRQAAIPYLEQALRVDSSHEPARRLLDEARAGRSFDQGSFPTVILQEPVAPDEERGGRIRQQIADVIANAYFNLGVIHSRRGRAADAAGAMMRASSWNPNLDGIDRAAGIALFYADRFTDAIPALARHLAAHASDDVARKLLETSYLMTGGTGRAPVAESEAAKVAPGASPGSGPLAAAPVGRPPEETEQELWGILAREPANLPALNRLGSLLLAANRYVEAESVFRRATEIAPTHRDAWLGRAKTLELSGKTADARIVLETAVAQIPGDPALEVELARTLVQLGEPRSSLEHLARIPERERPPTAVSVELGARIALGEVEETRALLAQASANFDEPTTSSLVDLLLEHGRASDARSLAESAHGRGMKSAPLLVSGARARLAAGERAGAEAWYEQALDADSTFVPALAGLADLIATRDPERATELFLIARSHGDRSPSLLRSLALSAAAALRFSDALDAASALRAVSQDDVEAVNLLGTIQLQTGDWPAAEQTFSEMAALAVRDPRAPLGIGIARYGQRKYSQAEAALEQSLELNPSLAEAHYQLALVARDEGRSGVAIQRLERTIALMPRHQAAHVTLGSLLIDAGEYEQALPVLERAIGLGPTSPDPYYQLGLLFARMKQPERARQAMEQFRRLRDRRVTNRQ